MITNNKCLDCTKRHVGCHSTCEDYLKFRKELDELNKQKRKERDMEYASRPTWKKRRK